MPGGPEMPAFEPELPQPKYKIPLFGGRKTINVLVIGGLIVIIVFWFWHYIFWRGLEMTLSQPILNANGTQIDGTFRIDEANYGYLGNGTGGACLVADISQLVTKQVATQKGVFDGNCTTQEQCLPLVPSGWKPGDPPTDQKWWGYCIPDEQNVGRCWYKVVEGGDKRLCNKSPFNPNPVWQKGIDHAVPFEAGFNVSDFYRDNTGGKPAKWRLTGLLWGTKVDEKIEPYGDPACISPDGKQCQ